MKSSANVILSLWVFGAVLSGCGIQAGTGGIEEASTSNPQASQTDTTKFVPGTAVSRKKRLVVLTVAAENLMDKDIGSRSDPVCIVEGQDFMKPEWKERGRTETIENNLNPSFKTKIRLDYYFEIFQPLRFKLYDIDDRSNTKNVRKHDFLGFVKTNLAKLVKAGEITLDLNLNEDELDMTEEQINQKRLEETRKKTSNLAKTINNLTKKPKPDSKIKIWAEEYKDGEQSDGDNLVVMDIRAITALSVRGKKKWYGLNRPNAYIDISKAMNKDATKFVLVHRVEPKYWRRKPVWPRMLAVYSDLANEDPKRPLKFECKDWQNRSDHGVIGSFVTTVEEIQNERKKRYVLIDEERKKKEPTYENSGIITIDHFEIVKTSSFLDYIMGNLDINAIIVIDFTGSNGNPSSLTSLHYINPDTSVLNKYEQALVSVVTIIEQYDTDKLFPTYGFGAQFSRGGDVYHLFAVNSSMFNPNCEQVEGVLAAYRECLPTIILSGPTYLQPAVHLAVKTAKRYRRGKKYAIQLILTDGRIDDLEETKNEVIDGSDLPLSIIIVGIGNANFDSMDELDSDGGLLQSQTKVAKRDIVQFVPFRNFYREGDEGAKELLAKEVLAEIPKQLITYMATHNLRPRRKTINKPVPTAPKHQEPRSSKLENVPGPSAPPFQESTSSTYDPPLGASRSTEPEFDNPFGTVPKGVREF